jgi:hypothetical protein
MIENMRQSVESGMLAAGCCVNLGVVDNLKTNTIK